MRKHLRGDRSDNDEPLSVGRVEYLEQARQRQHAKRLRRTAAILVVLVAVVLFATGLVGSSVAVLKDFVDTARITLFPGTGWPQQTGVMEPLQVEPLTSGFVELGSEGCVVYSNTGSRLNSIQSGYARPALAAGKNRFVLYNRSGNELRVESRTQNLYTKTLENTIFLCAMSDNGTLAVVTDDVGSMAQLLVYSPTMEQQLSWSMDVSTGTPLRMAFSPDNRKLAVAAITANAGQMVTNLYLLDLAQGDPVQIGSEGGVPKWVSWLSGSSVLVVYDDRAVLYNVGGGEQASYSFNGMSLRDISVDSSGNVGLLLISGQICQVVTLDRNLGVQFTAGVPSANKIVRTGSVFYLLTESAVECYASSGEHQWTQSYSVRPQALLAGTKQLLMFSGNTVQTVPVPEES